jgi:hypothetical protein
MFPGTVSKMSVSKLATARDIHPKTDIVILTGQETLVNIFPPFSGFSGAIIFIPVDYDLNISGSGNIHTGVNIILPQARASLAVFIPNFKDGSDPDAEVSDQWLFAPLGTMPAVVEDVVEDVARKSPAKK